MKNSTSGIRVDSPSFPLLKAGITYWGVTTGAGAVTGLTLVDSLCSTAGLQPGYVGQNVKLLTGAAAGQTRVIALHDLATGTLTFNDAFTDYNGAVYQVPAGTLFCIGAVGAADSLLATKWSGDDTLNTYNIEIAHGVAEQDMFEISLTTRYGLSVYVDLNTLVTVAEGGTVTLRLKNKIDEVNYRTVATASFTVGVTEIHPSFEAIRVNHNCKVTIQLTAAVTAQRTITYHYIDQEFE